jgi:hypothetical protein
MCLFVLRMMTLHVDNVGVKGQMRRKKKIERIDK